MKISIFGISNKSKNQTVKTFELAELINLIKANEDDYYVYRYRDDYDYLKAMKSDFGHLNAIKDICVAAEYYRKASGMRALRVYNGIVAIEVHDLSNQFEVDAVKRQSALLPQPMSSMNGAVRMVATDKTEERVNMAQVLIGRFALFLSVEINKLVYLIMWDLLLGERGNVVFLIKKIRNHHYFPNNLLLLRFFLYFCT